MQGAFSMKVSPCCFINSKNQSWGLCAASRGAFSWAWLFVPHFAASGHLQLGFWAGFAELPPPLKLCGESQSFAGCMDWCSSVQLCELEPSPQGIPRSRALPSSTSGLTSAAAAPVGSCKCYKHTHTEDRTVQRPAELIQPYTCQNCLSCSPLVSTLTPAFAN